MKNVKAAVKTQHEPYSPITTPNPKSQQQATTQAAFPMAAQMSS